MTSQMFDDICSSLAPIMVEMAAVVCFVAGFLLLRKGFFNRFSSPNKLQQQANKSSKDIGKFDAKLVATIEATAASGNPSAVLEAWRAGQLQAPTPKVITKAVAQAFLDCDPDALFTEFLWHMGQHESCVNTGTATILLETTARSGQVPVLEQLWSRLQQDIGLYPSVAMLEVTLGGFAAAGLPEKVQQYRRSVPKLSARGHSLIMKGFLKHGLLSEVLEEMAEMRTMGHSIPSFALVQIFRISDECLAETYDKLVELGVPLPVDALAALLENCAGMPVQADLAKKVEKNAKVELSSPCYDSLLKIFSSSCDARALQIFSERKSHGISENLLVLLLNRCAESKFLGLVDEIVKYARSNSLTSMQYYSALMKVYAYSEMYEKACDLYKDIKAEGLQPDPTMYGCLMKFSAECGRTELSLELADKVSVLEIQNYMSLIRAAGRDRDPDRAFGILKQLRDNNITPDGIALNCVVDVCVKANDLKRAERLVEEMKEMGMADIVTYNTLLKGYCMSDLKAALALLEQMSAATSLVTPNEVSFNCILNGLSLAGKIKECWQIVEQMQEKNVAPDSYTVSILLKNIKNTKTTSHRDVQKCLTFVDAAGVDPCSDDIMFTSLLEVCLRHHELKRVAAILAKFEASSMRPSAHSYAAIIKAFASLERVDKCWFYWDRLQVARGIEPSDVVWGCMLDALVSNSKIEEAVQLFEKSCQKPNPVIFSILLKGLSQEPGNASRSMDLWRALSRKGMKMNIIAYNTLLDSQAKQGKLKAVSEIMEMMAEDNIKPDAITLSTVCKGYAIKGEISRALHVLEGMHEAGIPHGATVYNTILDGCAKHEGFDHVDSILAKMKEQHIAPTNFTLGILINLYSRQRNLEKAFKAFEELPELGQFERNPQVWSSLLRACVYNNKPLEAYQVFLHMRAAGVEPDVRSCATLLRSLVRDKFFEEAVSVVDEIYGLKATCKACDIELEQDCLESLLACISQHGLYNQLGSPLLKRLRSAGVHVRGSLMVSAFSVQAAGKPQKAQQPRAKKVA